VLLTRVNTAWRDALHLVQPDTVLRWHRDLFTLFWRRRSRRTHRSRGLGAEVVELIRTMANANVLWGLSGSAASS
jgi:putative transposase